ncbi:hypothetical protein KUV50_09085 [Membranicola marinus]|uniref:Solute-binding protein family 5 domain-containing protein n=1 Tax=Membranihabitans marinus TaxID=1227546 RepID=A0A953HP92_9BACT|nr:ABC transporter substrate-binding protein [Membranihabitans marinus]MBY5958283.1 hypothetical protein [Membranihabitans marinus]
MKLCKFNFGSIFIVCLVAFYACQHHPPSQSTNILRVQVKHAPDIINAALSRLSVSSFIENTMSLPLAVWNEESMSWLPVLIDDYEPRKTKGGIDFMLHLRPEAQWSDGVSISTQDLMYTLKMGLNPFINQQSWAAYLELITAIQQRNDSLLVTMETPYILADEFIAGLKPYPAHVLDPNHDLKKIPFERFLEGRFSVDEEKILQALASNFNSYGTPENWPSPVSGLFRMEAWAPDQSITLVRTKNRWIDRVDDLRQFFKTNIDTLQYVIIADPQNALHAFTSGGVDVLNTIDQKDSAILSSFWGRVHNVPTLQQFYIAVNHKNPLLGQINIRRALNMAIHRKDLITRLFHGYGQPAYGPIHPDKGYFSARSVDYSPDQARDLLKEAGCVDENNDGILECESRDGVRPLSFHIWTTRSELSRNVATLIKGYWKTIGVDLEIQSSDFRSFLPELQNKTYDFATLALRQNNLLDDPYPLWHSSQSSATGKNYQALANSALDHTLEQLRGAVVPAEQIKYYQEFQQTFDTLTPVFFLVAPDDAVGFRNDINLHWTPQRPGYDLLRSTIDSE